MIWAIFFAVFLLCFRKNIAFLFKSLSDLCNRTTTLQYGEFKLGANSQILLGDQGGNEVKYAEMLKAFENPIVTNEENIIKNQLIEYKWSSKQAINVIVAQLAYKNFLIKLLIIDKLIYEEQIKLLFYLNTQNKPCDESDLQKYYLSWKEREWSARLFFWKKNAKEIDIKYEDFLAFLCQNGLINQNVHKYNITMLGKEYLSFIVKIGRPLHFPCDNKSEPAQENTASSEPIQENTD
jgi:hypothetical protein